MGNLLAAQHGSQSEEANELCHAYRYPAKSGSYFGTHFLMGGERFDMSPPEAFLFGENTDLNFLAPKPVQFPYATTPTTEPTRSLNALVNIRRDSLKFVKIEGETDGESSCKYNISFLIDCDVPCSVTIYLFSSETVQPNNGLCYVPKSLDFVSDAYHFGVGACQEFSVPQYIFEPSLYDKSDLTYNPSSDAIPIVIHCVAKQLESDGVPQSHATLAVVQESAEGHGFVLKPLKQKLFIDGVTYLLQEIYGIENKNANAESEECVSTTDDDNCADCVVCMSELRDTLILPCRHLCLCNACAETLRYKASNCPICRSPFRALLQIKTLRRLDSTVSAPNLSDPTVSSEGPPSPGGFLTTRYETVPLIEALNGPVDQTQTCVTAIPAPGTSGVTLTSSQSEPDVAFRSKSPPTAPPRQGKKKKDRRSIVPIQEVLTPQSIQAPAEAPNDPDTIESDSEAVTVVVMGATPVQVQQVSPSSVRCGPFVTGLEIPKDTSDSEADSTELGGQQSANQVTRISIGQSAEPDSVVLPGTVVHSASVTALDIEELGTPRSSYSTASIASSTKPLLPDDQQESTC